MEGCSVASLRWTQSDQALDMQWIVTTYALLLRNYIRRARFEFQL